MVIIYALHQVKLQQDLTNKTSSGILRLLVDYLTPQ